MEKNEKKSESFKKEQVSFKKKLVERIETLIEERNIKNLQLYDGIILNEQENEIISISTDGCVVRWDPDDDDNIGFFSLDDLFDNFPPDALLKVLEVLEEKDLSSVGEKKNKK